MSLEALFVCSVDLFMLISGYFMAESYIRDMLKPFSLFVQVVVVSEGCYFIQIAMGRDSFSLKSFLGCLIPNNYFVILYITVYIISPYINKLMSIFSTIELRKFIIILSSIFLLWPTLVDLFCAVIGNEINGISTIGRYGSQYGYTIVNFIMLYMLGVYIRRDIERYKSISFKYLFAGLMSGIFVLTIWIKFEETTALEYCNPVLVFIAFISFLLFKKIDIGKIKWINELAEAAFFTSLLHYVFLPYVNIKEAVSANPLILVIHIFLTMVVVYTICWIIYKIYMKTIGNLIDCILGLKEIQLNIK